MDGIESGCDLGSGEGQAMMLSLEILLPSRNSRFLTQIKRIGKKSCGGGEQFSQSGFLGILGLGWSSGGKLEGAKLGGEPHNLTLWRWIKTQF